MCHQELEHLKAILPCCFLLDWLLCPIVAFGLQGGGRLSRDAAAAEMALSPLALPALPSLRQGWKQYPSSLPRPTPSAPLLPASLEEGFPKACSPTAPHLFTSPSPGEELGPVRFHGGYRSARKLMCSKPPGPADYSIHGSQLLRARVSMQSQGRRGEGRGRVVVTTTSLCQGL